MQKYITYITPSGLPFQLILKCFHTKRCFLNMVDLLNYDPPITSQAKVIMMYLIITFSVNIM